MKKVKTRINITTSRNGTDAPSPKHFVIATMGSSEALHDVEISALDTAAAIRAAREGFEVSLETRWEVSMQKSNSIGIGHSDPAWDSGRRERSKRHEAMWRAMAGR
jgi:hypothetical protein